MRKRKSKKSKVILKNLEELGFYEREGTVEELRDAKVERDCFMEGEIDDKSIISRIKLF